MKVLVVDPGVHFSVADVCNGLVKGLKANGCDVGVLNLGDRVEFYTRAQIQLEDGALRQAFNLPAAYEMAAKGVEVVCYEWWPDIVIVVSGFFIPPSVWATLARRPHHVVYWATESPYEDDRQGRPGRYVDTLVLNDPTNQAQFCDEINANTHYFHHSYDPDIHHPGPGVPDLECDFGFVATGFPSRIDFLEAVNWDGLTVKLGGNWAMCEPDSPLLPFVTHPTTQCMDNTVTADLYRSARASANLYRKEHSDESHADGWAMGPREVELAACGTFFLREPRAEGDWLLPMLPTFTESDEFSDKLRWWLAHPEQAADAALAARAAIADRTFTNTAARLLRIVEAAGTKRAA